MTFDLDFAAWWDAWEELYIDMGVGTVVVLFFSCLEPLYPDYKLQEQISTGMGSSHKLDIQGRNAIPPPQPPPHPPPPPHTHTMQQNQVQSSPNRQASYNVAA